MSTVIVTANVRDVMGRSDSTAWVFSSPETRDSPDGRVVSRRPRSVQPLDGMLTVELLPGPVRVEFGGESHVIEVPETDADLWDLLEAAG